MLLWITYKLNRLVAIGIISNNSIFQFNFSTDSLFYKRSSLFKKEKKFDWFNTSILYVVIYPLFQYGCHNAILLAALPSISIYFPKIEVLPDLELGRSVGVSFRSKGKCVEKSIRERPSFQFPLPLSIHHWAMPKGKTTQHFIDIINLWIKSEESDGFMMKDRMIEPVGYHIKWPYIISIHPSIHLSNTHTHINNKHMQKETERKDNKRWRGKKRGGGKDILQNERIE